MKHFPLVVLLIVTIGWGFGSSLHAQKEKPEDFGIKSKKALKAFQNGNAQTKFRDYFAAINLYKEAVEIEPTFGEAWLQMGASYFALRQYAQSYAALEQARDHLHTPNSVVYYYLGESALFQDKFNEALENYDQFLERKQPVPKRYRDTALKNREKAKMGVEALRNAITFKPVNLGRNINTQFSEYLPYLTADGQTIFYTARRPGSTGGFNREYRDYTEDFFFSTMKDGEWGPSQNLGAPVNTEMNEGAASFSPDGQYVFFTACSRKDGYGNCDIYVSKLDGDKWLEPRNLGPIINTPDWESQPCISNDGRTLYFSSNRPGGLGGYDIWYSTLEKGRWTEPQNLGAPINTEGTEVAPFLHADGMTLYFSSDKHPGYGKLDLFISKNTGEGWTTPANLGYPLNSSAVEGNIYITSDGTRGFINSSRDDPNGKSDIYMFELDERIRPNFTTYVRGVVTDVKTGDPLYARVTFINIETRDTIRSVRTNKSSGKFLLTLPMDQDYAAYVDRPGYLFASRFFSLKNINSEETPYYDVDITLDPLQVGIEVVMSAIFYETDKYDLLDRSKTELENLVQFMKQNSAVRIEIGGHTDDVGSDAYNLKLSQNRAGEVRKYLISRGISSARIDAKGYGETQPVTSETSEEGRARNRRTVCRIVGT
ncbi:MAG: OmpA family protein [Bacteroidota bacterium]